jgi:hypothetical protein
LPVAGLKLAFSSFYSLLVDKLLFALSQTFERKLPRFFGFVKSDPDWNLFFLRQRYFAENGFDPLRAKKS